MIVLALLNGLRELLELLTVNTSLPGLPDTIISMCDSALTYVLTGCDVVVCFIGTGAGVVVAICFDIIIAFWIFGLGWSFVWFIIRKIPVYNIRE